VLSPHKVATTTYHTLIPLPRCSLLPFHTAKLKIGDVIAPNQPLQRRIRRGGRGANQPRPKAGAGRGEPPEDGERGGGERVDRATGHGARTGVRGRQRVTRGAQRQGEAEAEAAAAAWRSWAVGGAVGGGVALGTNQRWLLPLVWRSFAGT
jgi:hypothetical protein